VGAVGAALAVLVVALAGTHAAAGAWPGANGRIAFDRAGDIYSVLPDGTHLRRLTRTSAPENEPRYSARGHRIVYLRGGRDKPTSIWVMNADGSHQHAVTRNHDSRSVGDREPAFSRSGRTIVFASDRDVSGQTDIYAVRSDGTRLRRVTHTDSLSESGPVFTPDSEHIVFSGETDPLAGHAEIFSMRLDGSHRRRITHEARVPGERAVHRHGANALEPDLSPHGATIVFFRDSGFGNDARLYRVDFDGDDERLFEGSRGDRAPVFSPDGRRIAFDRLRGGFERILTMGLDGRHVRPVGRSRGFDDEPDWQPVGDED
jgi:Tol biopolymer transport system component